MGHEVGKKKLMMQLLLLCGVITMVAVVVGATIVGAALLSRCQRNKVVVWATACLVHLTLKKA
jgi:hypothetical protein